VIGTDTVTGRAYRLQGRAPARDRTAELTLVIAKCRFGGFAGDTAARVVLTPCGTPEGALHARFLPPTAATTTTDRAATTRAAILQALANGPQSVRALRDGIGGDRTKIDAALNLLHDQGHIRKTATKGLGGGYPWKSPHPLATPARTPAWAPTRSTGPMPKLPDRSGRIAAPNSLTAPDRARRRQARPGHHCRSAPVTAAR
jgi:hypothetical protein